MPAAPSRATASVSAASPLTGTVRTPRPSGSGGCPAICAPGGRDVVEPGRVGRPDGQRLAADDPLEAVRGVVRDHPAVVDDGDLVGQRVGLLQVLRGEQHGRAVGDQVADDVPHVLALGRVEAGGRLVQEDHRRAAHQGRGEVEPAAHAAGVGLGRRSAASVRSNQASSSSAALPRGALAGRAAGRSAPGSGCRSGPRRPRRTGRSGRSSAAPCRAACARRTRRRGRFPRRPEQGGQDADGGGLAGAVGPQHAEHGAPPGRQVDPGERLRLTEALGQPGGFNR